MLGRLMQLLRRKRPSRESGSTSAQTYYEQEFTKDPCEEFFAEVRKFQDRPIRRLDWLPGEHFTPDGGWEVMATDYCAVDLMTGTLVTQTEQRKAAFYPFEPWSFWIADETENEHGCPGRATSRDGVECQVLMDSANLTAQQLQENNRALRVIYSCWQDKRPFNSRLWRVQERFTSAITYNHLSGARFGEDNYRLCLSLHSMDLNGYTTAMQQPEGMRLGICSSGHGFTEKERADDADVLFLEIPGWQKEFIPSAAFCSFCGFVSRSRPSERFACSACGRQHPWRWREDATKCTACGSELQDGQYCVVCCARREPKNGNANTH
jgi:hypothetical protein